MNVAQHFWNLYSKQYDNLACHYKPYREVQNEIIEYILKYHKPCEAFLDAGCGTGNYTYLLMHHGYAALAVDGSDRMIAAADKKLLQYNKSVAKINLNAALPFSNDQFHGVLSINALYMLDDPGFTLSEFYRVMKNNGRLYFVTLKEEFKPFRLFLRYIKNYGFKSALVDYVHLISIGIFNYFIKAKQVRGSYRLWSEKEAKDMLETAGFRVETLKACYNDQSILCIAHKI